MSESFTLRAIPGLVTEIGAKLMEGLTLSTNRRQFFTTLSDLLREHVPFDRLCINLYDQEEGMLMYFTAAEGMVVSTLSPIRPAEASTTVAGRVIATRKPVIITDFANSFSGVAPHPIAEAGLNATMAFPLILDNEIIATLHCSFAQIPEHVYELTSFLLALSPCVATCLGAILSLEKSHSKISQQWLPMPQSVEEAIICHSPLMREVMRKVNVISKLDIPVLLLGETGTGKSLLAQAIHRLSQRKNAQFVKVNCPALPQSLFESELFGHAKGAFTGAIGKRIGRFEMAHGGTLFLDELAELSPEMQSKLLQVLEDSTFERVGESMSLAVDVRIIAATNIRVGEALESGKLRPDLYYRLSPCTITIPPLRERQEDIPPLVTSLSAQVATRLDLPHIPFRGEVIRALSGYGWPGNIRELRNVITRLLVLNSTGQVLSTKVVEEVLAENRRLMNPAGEVRKGGHSAKQSMQLSQTQETAFTLEAVERQHILDALRQTGGRLSGPDGAAALLGLPRSTLQHRMTKLGISARQPR